MQNIAGTNLYYGNRDAIYAYDHLPICSGGGTAQSTFVRLSPNYQDYIETGLQQVSGDASGTARFWAEYRLYPENVVVKNYTSKFGLATTSRYYSFKLESAGGTQWQYFWSGSSNPDTATWTSMDLSPSLAARVGDVESEISRYGDASAADYVNHLETQNRQFGGWGPWTNLQCDPTQGSITDWRAIKVDNADWYMANQSSGGLC